MESFRASLRRSSGLDMNGRCGKRDVEELGVRGGQPGKFAEGGGGLVDNPVHPIRRSEPSRSEEQITKNVHRDFEVHEMERVLVSQVRALSRLCRA